MSWKDCINAGAAGGAIDPERAEQAAGLFDELEAEYSRTEGPGEAGRRAAMDTVEQLKWEAAQRARQRLLQADTWARISADMSAYRNAKGETDLALAWYAHFRTLDEQATFSNVAARREAIVGRARSRAEQMLVAGTRDVLGRVRNAELMHDIGRAAYGQTTGPGGRALDPRGVEMAAALADVFEWLRLKFNAAGGHIPKRARWNLPQNWATHRVAPVKFEQFRADFIRPDGTWRVAFDDMIDPATGLPFKPGPRWEEAFHRAWEDILTDGAIKMKPSAGGGRALANRRVDHRFFQLRSYEDWQFLMGKYGTAADPWSAMIGHTDSMARDIALMEILGPNPNATMRWGEQTVTQWAKLRDAERAQARGKASKLWQDHAKVQTGRARLAYDLARGELNTPVSSFWANVVSGTADMLSAAQLGTAVVPALVTDPNFGRLARRMVGMPQIRMANNYLALLNPADAGDRRLAARLGLVLENGIRVGAAQARIVGEWSGPEITKRVSDFWLRMSGLSPVTERGRMFFHLDFMGFLADQAGRRFDQLLPQTQGTLRRFGIEPQDWDLVRTTTPYEPANGVRFLRPEDIAQRTDLTPGQADQLATRVLEMVQTMTEYAVPSTSVEGRVMFGAAKPGTIPGFFGRVLTMYKNFALTFTHTHIMHAIRRNPQLGRGGRLGYALDLAISGMILGAVALQLRQIVSGRDPRPMVDDDGVPDPRFWGAAWMQGGGVGLIGDTFFSDQNRFGGGVVSTFAGPMAGLIEDVSRSTIGNVQQLIGGEDANLGADLAGLVRRYTPGGSTWYGRVALERALFDRLSDWIDPNINRRRAQQERRWQRDFGQGFWWAPGDRTPARAPDLGNAVGR